MPKVRECNRTLIAEQMVSGISALEILSYSDCGRKGRCKDNGSVVLKAAIAAVMCVGVY